MFVHHVFFWLKENLAAEETALFEKMVLTLLDIEHVQTGDVGKPASTSRPIIERSYSYSLLLVFADERAHDAYQPHPVHKTFIESCAHLWERVVIYDSESLSL